MREGESTGVTSRQVTPIEKAIERFFWEEIYAPLFAELEEAGLENSVDPVIDALKKGKLYYQDGVFFGSINSQISKKLRSIGAKYDARKKAWTLSQASLTPDLIVAVTAANARISRLKGKIIDKIDAINIDEKLAQMNLPFSGVAGAIDKQVTQSLGKLAVEQMFTPEMREAIAEEWGDNLKLYIKGWSDENILNLRNLVTSNTLAGNRGRDLEKMIMKNYGSSKKKAKFLARQETSVLYSKIREQRYKDAGVTKYKWVANLDGRERDLHRELNGKIFSWDSPPIIDERTGQRGHPGEAFGCRCRAKPVLD